jgi:hypothetical protein
VPRKVFVSGEILTASDVNTNLMDQAVMVFDDSAARGSAIPSPTEGMVTYLKDTDALEKYTNAWVPAAPGKILQVIQTVKTDAFTAGLNQGVETDLTGLTASITPSNTSSKVMVFVSVSFGAPTQSSTPNINVFRDATAISVGAAVGSRSRRTTGDAVTSSLGIGAAAAFVLDSPNTTSSTTYSVKVSHNNSGTASPPITVYVNRNAEDADSSRTSRAVSSITLMEVAG